MYNRALKCLRYTVFGVPKLFERGKAMAVLNKSTKLAVWLSIAALLIASQLTAKYGDKTDSPAPKHNIVAIDSSKTVEKKDGSANNQSLQNSRADFEIRMQVVLNGAGQGNSADYNVNTLVGQNVNGSGSSADFVLSHGFWPYSGGGTEYLCGDANGDEQVNVGDAVFLITYIFKGGAAPDPVCLGDANGDGNTNVGDAVYLIAYIFKGGPAPVADCCL